MKDIQPGDIRICNNYVLIRLVPMNDEVDFNGKKLKIDTTFEPQDHVSVCGTVECVPRKLIYDIRNANTMRWKTNIEIQLGDLAYFDYHSALMAMGRLADASIQYPEDNCFVYQGDVYIFLKYEDLFCVSRVVHEQSEIIMLNGYVIVKPDTDEVKGELAENLPYHLRIKQSKTRGVVLYAGSKNEAYINGKDTDADGFLPGDRIFFKQNYIRRIEYDLHATLPKGVIIVQRKDIMAKDITPVPSDAD